ncbi:MAG TPA: hypothetical protein VHW90_05870 [Stellaceae bacterium]|nr:hypothetical protein [Stellaceae bacterium]
MAGRSDRFGREKASQRRKKIRPQEAVSVEPGIMLRSGDPVRWEGHEGAIVRIVGDIADIADSAVAGRIWRLPLATLSRR